MSEAKIDDGSVYFEIIGEGKPLVLICGITGSIEYYWQALLPELSAHYQVIAFDSRGMGKTKYPDKSFTIEQIADDVSNLLDHLGIEKASFFGHSMGSAVSQAFASKYPNRIEKMILCNTFSKLTSRNRTVVEGILDLLDENVPQKKIFWSQMPWMFSEAYLSNDQVKEKLKAFYAERKLCSIGLRRQIESLLIFDSEKWLGNLDVKTLVISSADDIMFPPEKGEQMAKKIKCARYVIIEGGHASPMERAPQLVTLIKDFLGK